MWNERGAALLEAMIAMVVISTVSVALLSIVAAGYRSEELMREREHTIERAHTAMTAMALLGPDDLNLRLGQRHEGNFIVDVQRPRRSLYRVAIVDTTSRERELLTTVLYRPAPESPSAP